MIEKLKGNRTYLAAGALVVLGVAHALGYADVSPEVYEAVKTALGAAAIAFLRLGVAEAATK